MSVPTDVALGYYLDKCLYDEVADLFAVGGEVRFMGGAFQGKAGLRRLTVTGKRWSPA